MPIYDSWVLAAQSVGAAAPLPVHEILEPIFRRRGVTCAEELAEWRHPGLGSLHDPASIGGMDAAAERILRAVRDRETILIYGDYDVDGVTSIVLLRTVLRSLGADVDFVVPHRLFDGYGLKTEVLERVLRDRDVRVVITVDCGITSVEPVAHAVDRGIDVIITDHHLPPELVPKAAAVLNPKQEGCSYPYKELAGVGVAFKLCCELIRRSGSTLSIASLVKIAAIGTVADVAPLTGENRAIVKIGLAGLANPRNPGLRALFRALGLLGRPLRASDVGFRVGPRINAAGRLASASTAVDLFDAQDEESAGPLVEQLERLNRQRQSLEAAVIRSAEEAIAGFGALPPIIVVAGDAWHRGVVGLCAGRLAQKLNRPVLAIARENGECVGSGRSIEGIDLHAELAKVSDLFSRFGGHTHACGFSFPSENLEPLRDRLVSQLAGTDPGLFRRRIEIDAEVDLRQIDDRFTGDHAALEPFGQGCRQPAFLARGVAVEAAREFSPGCVRLSVRQGAARFSAVAWPSASTPLGTAIAAGSTVDLVFRLEPDRFEGHRLEVVDAAAAGDAPVAP